LADEQGGHDFVAARIMFETVEANERASGGQLDASAVRQRQHKQMGLQEVSRSIKVRLIGRGHSRGCHELSRRSQRDAKLRQRAISIRFRRRVARKGLPRQNCSAKSQRKTDRKAMDDYSHHH
jgi:hypothetical protein